MPKILDPKIPTFYGPGFQIENNPSEDNFNIPFKLRKVIGMNQANPPEPELVTILFLQDEMAVFCWPWQQVGI